MLEYFKGVIIFNIACATFCRSPFWTIYMRLRIVVCSCPIWTMQFLGASICSILVSGWDFAGYQIVTIVVFPMPCMSRATCRFCYDRTPQIPTGMFLYVFAVLRRSFCGGVWIVGVVAAVFSVSGLWWWCFKRRRLVQAVRSRRFLRRVIAASWSWHVGAGWGALAFTGTLM